MSEPTSSNEPADSAAANPYEESTESGGSKVGKSKSKTVDDEKSFEELSEESNVGIVREFVDFLKYNKKWWLTPIVAVLLLVGVLIVLTTSGAAPFLYTFW